MAGKADMYSPNLGDTNNDLATNYPYKCGNFTIRPEGIYTDGFMLMYYVVPLFPLLPESETKNDLEIKITIHSDVEPVFDLSLNDIQVQLNEPDKILFPYDKEITVNNAIPDKPWFYKTFRFVFEADRHEIDEFSVLFPNAINDCLLPPVKYKKKTERHVVTPVNQ